ncbi:hypothetical protein RJ639_014107 [Escallonia herrerae]|uniref:Pentatricopeptide repeat-containing protein n=1 Tax=Escallonia herrerae TaxID=1293975 RepID=A0AA89APD1_9ASTE|nr:hypothetical protein RJ639_014107 [Escallonia herrerae]
MGSEEILLDSHEVFSELIEGYVAAVDLRGAVSTYDRMRGLGLVPSLPSYRALLNYLVQMSDTHLVYRVFVDMLDMGLGVSIAEKSAWDRVIQLLCRDGKELELLGYSPDEITFGILIGCSCRERKLKNAFSCLSEVFSRCQKPHIHSYNALIGGVFQEGMWTHAREVLHEMDDRGVTPDMSSFRVLLAGYCKAKKFDEVKSIVAMMADRGLIQLSSLDDPVSRAFMVLGLNQLTVRVRRDNDFGFSKTEFFDNLGNGLYLETDMDEYEKTMTGILDGSMIPDYSCLVLKDCRDKNLKNWVVILDEMVRWGQELSLSAFSMLLKELCASSCSTKAITNILDKLPKLTNQLDQETLNLLVQLQSRKGYTHRAKREMLKETLELFEAMLVGYPLMVSDTFHVFLEKLCDMGFTGTAHDLAEELSNRGCVMDRKAYNYLIGGFCKEERFSEAFRIADTMLAKNMTPQFDVSVLLIPHFVVLGLIPDTAVYNVLIQGFSQAKNFRKVAEILAVMIRKNMSISIWRRGLQPDVVTYDFLVYGFCRCKAVSSSLQHLSAMMSKGLRPSNCSLKAVITSLCHGGELVQALKLSREMEYRGILHGSVIQNGIVEGLLIHGKLQEAVNFLNRMVEKGLIPENINYDNLIKRLSRCGSQEKAVDLLDIMLKRGNTPNYTSYDSLIQGFCTCHKLDEALDFHSETLTRNLKPSIKTWTVLIHNLCEDGKTEEAEMLLHSMVQTSEIPSREIYCSTVDRYCSENNLSKASELLHAMQQKGYEPDFETQWSLIRNLSTSNDKNNVDNSGSFLSRLHSDSGFVRRRDPKAKIG